MRAPTQPPQGPNTFTYSILKSIHLTQPWWVSFPEQRVEGVPSPEVFMFILQNNSYALNSEQGRGEY